MANLSNQLQAYLQRNDKNGTNGEADESLLPGESSKVSKWFSKMTNRQETASPVIDETSNGWFSDAQKDPCLPSLSKKQRIIGFVGCIGLGVFCFALASFYIPFIVLKARKFSLLYSLGSLFFISSFALLWGPMNHLKHLVSGDRLPFTTVYFGTMFGTLYFALWAKSTVFTIIFAVAQILSLVWYVISYIPGGQTGLKFFSKIFYVAASKTVQKTLPV
ncbi:uncharacterized protein LOC135497017 [Lineus longissimus]|uniref:uncharacterized protein LOC135497017 n=1 Tax=Lineus longissimus TaxID=88925 RepID=UPI002B4D96AA